MSVDNNKGSIRYLFVFYSIPIRPNVKNDRHKGTKKVYETADMVMGLPTESTKGTKTRIPMKLDDKSQQITQITQKYKSVKSVQSVDNKRKVCRGLLVLHELISLRHAVIELAVAIHINLCLDWLLQSLQKCLYGLQEGDIGAC